jgi:hypothetical protein
MRLLSVSFIIIGFCLGFMASLAILSLPANLQLPISFGSAAEQNSPYNHISEDLIHVYDDKILLDIPNATWSTFADTNSMDPFIDYGANGLEIRPKTYLDIHVGDIISFKHNLINGILIHRVVRTGFDDDGWFAITKGDNNNNEDPGKVRFDDVHGVLVGVIY